MLGSGYGINLLTSILQRKCEVISALLSIYGGLKKTKIGIVTTWLELTDTPLNEIRINLRVSPIKKLTMETRAS